MDPRYVSQLPGLANGHTLTYETVDLCVCVCVLTVLVQEQLVEPQPAGLLADEAVHVLGAVVVDGDGVLQRLHTRLQTEGDLGVSHRVPGKTTAF